MAGVDQKSGKVIKKSPGKAHARKIEVHKAPESTSENQQEVCDTKAQIRKSQGIVINGKTYTCATCKTGHRVGVCKHAKERPMKPTHPPGRPPAGAPKKIICDCPKDCACAKKDCKCARKCDCTQVMYMLVYIPAPGDIDDENDENGQWRLGEEVTTDLKGNILTVEEIETRRHRKQAIRMLPNSRVSRNINPEDNARLNPKKGCCSHKETVITQTTRPYTSLKSGNISQAMARGCNCGDTCTCAFCPQHPNNLTSMNMARQQAVHFTNNNYVSNQPIVQFQSSVAQDASCMGGPPQFAISRTGMVPSLNDLHQTFPDPGVFMCYPIWSLRSDFTNISQMQHGVAVVNGSLSAEDTMSMHQEACYNTPANSVPGTQETSIESPQNTFVQQQINFGVGDAFVANAGSEEWTFNNPLADIWSSGVPALDYAGPSLVSPEMLNTNISPIAATPRSVTAKSPQVPDSLLAQPSVPDQPQTFRQLTPLLYSFPDTGSSSNTSMGCSTAAASPLYNLEQTVGPLFLVGPSEAPKTEDDEFAWKWIS